MTLDGAFPARPVFLRAGPKPGLLWPIGGLLVCLGLLIPALWTFGPGIVQDYDILNNLDPPQPRVAESEIATIDDTMIKRTLHPSVAFTHKFQCTGIQRIVRWCTAEIGHRVGLEWRRTEASYLFFDYHKSYVVGAVRAAGDATKITTAMAIEYYWSRVIILGVVSVVLFSGAVAAVGAIAKSRRLRAQLGALSRQPVRPIILEVRGVTELRSAEKGKRGAATQPVAYEWCYASPSSHEGEVSRSVLPPNNQPLFLTRSEGRTYALGAVNNSMPAPVLLDQRLDQLDLTQAERELVWSWQSEFAATYPAS